MNAKQQVLAIHGGEVFPSYEKYLEYLVNYEIDFEKLKEKEKGWKRHLQEDLGDDFEVIQPQMPSPRNAKYKEWKIWLEKYLSILRDNIILVGHSLGGIFWAKYLSENKFPVKISQLHLVAAPFDDNFDTSSKTEYYELCDFNFEAEKLYNIEKQIGKIFLYHSKDDFVVPFADLEKYANALPSAQKTIFSDRGHFLIENFPEIVENITQNRIEHNH